MPPVAKRLRRGAHRAVRRVRRGRPVDEIAGRGHRRRLGAVPRPGGGSVVDRFESSADRRAYCPAPDGPGGDGWFDPRVAVAFAVAIGGVVLVAAPVVWVRRRRREMDARGMAIDWDAMDAESMDPRRRARLESARVVARRRGEEREAGGNGRGEEGEGRGAGARRVRAARFAAVTRDTGFINPRFCETPRFSVRERSSPSACCQLAGGTQVASSPRPGETRRGTRRRARTALTTQPAKMISALMIGAGEYTSGCVSRRLPPRSRAPSDARRLAPRRVAMNNGSNPAPARPTPSAPFPRTD